MARYRRWFLIALMVFLGLEILTFAPGRLGGPKKQSPDPSKPSVNGSKTGATTVETVSQVMQGVDLVETEGGRKEWELNAVSAQGYKEKGNWKLTGVKVKFFGKSGVIYNVHGDQGLVHTEKKDIHISGNVIMTTSDGYQMTTDSMFYNHEKRFLKTDDFVELQGPKDKEGEFVMSGVGFDSNLDTNVMHLYKDVKTRKDVPPQRTMTINSVWARIDGKKNLAHFEDKVQVDLDEVRMTGNRADFNYEASKKVLESLVMEGNVRVTSQTHWAVSNRAEVYFEKDEYVLSGNPRVMQDENELRGQEIRFLKGGKEVRVIKAKARMDQEDAGQMTSGMGQ